MIFWDKAKVSRKQYIWYMIEVNDEGLLWGDERYRLILLGVMKLLV